MSSGERGVNTVLMATILRRQQTRRVLPRSLVSSWELGTHVLKAGSLLRHCLDPSEVSVLLARQTPNTSLLVSGMSWVLFFTHTRDILNRDFRHFPLSSREGCWDSRYN